MAEKVNIERLAAKNPSVDVKQVREAIRLLRQISETGVAEQTRYNLAVPFGRTTEGEGAGAEKAPREVRLRSHKR